MIKVGKCWKLQRGMIALPNAPKRDYAANPAPLFPPLLAPVAIRACQHLIEASE
jgi:hypothetical protein